MSEQTQTLGRRQCMGVLSRAPIDEVKLFVENLIPRLGKIKILSARTGLALLPILESSKGAQFYFGEILTAEARVLLNGYEGYAACPGRDLEQALALAVIDAALTAENTQSEIQAFVHLQKNRLDEADQLLFCQVEATRVEMDAFEWRLPK